jgi:hypothetical protein
LKIQEFDSLPGIGADRGRRVVGPCAGGQGHAR